MVLVSCDLKAFVLPLLLLRYMYWEWDFSPLQYYVYNDMSTIYKRHKTVASWLTVRLPSYADFVISK